MHIPALLLFTAVSMLLAAAALQPMTRASANDKLSDPPNVLAPFQPKRNSPGTNVVHHHGTGLENSLSHFANAHRAHR